MFYHHATPNQTVENVNAYIRKNKKKNTRRANDSKKKTKILIEKKQWKVKGKSIYLSPLEPLNYGFQEPEASALQLRKEFCILVLRVFWYYIFTP